MVPYKNAGFELKFLGTMNGGSDSHTNAYFYPEKDTLAFVDLSLLNFREASYLITPNLKRVILFLTHLHDDHASGVLKLAFYVKKHLPEVLLEVVTGQYIVREAFQVFYATGGKPVVANGKLDEVLRIYGQMPGGEIITRVSPEAELFFGQEVVPLEQQFEVPNWLLKTVPTTHSLRLSAVGFVFSLNGKAVIYSGDTNTTTRFYDQVEIYTSGDDKHEPLPTELYLDVECGDAPTHLSFEKVRTGLMRLMKRAPTLKVALMHYDNYGITHDVIQFNEELGEERLFVAEPKKV